MGGIMADSDHEEILEGYRRALNATADDEERKGLFLIIVCILDERRRTQPSGLCDTGS
jgi:hypothetical protein